MPLSIVIAAVVAVGAFLQLRHRRLPEVTATRVIAGPLEVTWTSTGYVEARTARISPPQAARVAAVLVREGDSVAGGQVLARLAADPLRAQTEGQGDAVRAARAEEAAAVAAVREADGRIADRIVQWTAAVEAARSRVAQAERALSREREIAGANASAARSDAEAAAEQLAELRSGARPQEIAQAEAAVSDAVAVQQRAAIEHQRQLRLFQQDAVARRAVDDAEEALNRADAQLKRARAALDLLRQGARREELAAAEARLRAARHRQAASDAELAGTRVQEEEVAERRAAVRQAEAQLAEARTARRELDTLRARLRAARSRTAGAKAALEGSRAELGERTLRAPFAGSVGRRLADPGDLAVPGQPMFSIVEADRPWIEAEADEQELAAVRLGEYVAVSMPAYPGRTFAGRVERIGSEAIPQIEQTRTSARVVRVRVSLDALPAAQRRLFRPGMEVDVSGKTLFSKRSLLVPNDAVRIDSTGTYLLSVSGDRLVRRPVRIGHSTGHLAQVLGGVKEGEPVVVSSAGGTQEGAQEGLREGSRVVVRAAP